jgi:hypothetical protein
MGEADWLAFVDDDEVVDARWLDALLMAQTHFAADVVTGPVISTYTATTPRWIVEGRFFERGRRPTGQVLQTAATNNVLVGMHVFRDGRFRFDTSMALTGGTDTHLFHRVSRAGFKIVWTDDALVYEEVPVSRANLAWLLQRQYRKGVVDVLLQRALEPSSLAAASLVGRSFGRLAKGVMMLPLVLMGGRRGVATALQRVARGTGALLRICGLGYEEYRAVHAASRQSPHENASVSASGASESRVHE